MAPLEKALWSGLWKIKTVPKIRHFMWRLLFGALAVSTRLQTKCILVDPICTSCRSEPETICHVLFNCRNASRVWNISGARYLLGVFPEILVFLTCITSYPAAKTKTFLSKLDKPFRGSCGIYENQGMCLSLKEYVWMNSE